jgi:catechol 2,3-dioxygenase-like lactoylglutathione lyase family enzyme
MPAFTFDHIHLRSPDPDATAAFYETMFGAEIIHTLQNGAVRVDMKVGGLDIFILNSPPGKAADAPSSPYLGLDHIGLSVKNIDAVVAELKAKGAVFTMEPNTIRPGVRIAFLRGPENVSIELLERS